MSFIFVCYFRQLKGIMESMKAETIYIACHQKENIPNVGGEYVALQVGKAHSKIISGFVSDDSGINISDKNPYYSELTGWYWIWKNQKHDIIGTCHYRRYFTSKGTSMLRKIGTIFQWIAGIYKKHYGLIYTNNISKWQQHILNSSEIKTFLNEFDIILPVAKIFKYSVREQYTKRHRAADITLTREIIKEQQPEYLDSFDAVFTGNRLHSFNMMITRWGIFDEYMRWLFPILFELEKRSDFPKNDPYQKRLCAFMAERLQSVWMNHNELKIKELPVIYFKKSKTTHF